MIDECIAQVSWIRHQDTHLLTAGRYTYTSDERFRAIHKVSCQSRSPALYLTTLCVQVLSEDYILQIEPVQVMFQYQMCSDDCDNTSVPRSLTAGCTSARSAPPPS